MPRLPEQVREALGRTEIMVLATVDPESGTWSCPVQFTADDRLRLSFLSPPTSRHVRNLRLDPRVSAAIYSWPGPPGGNLGLQLAGTAKPEGAASSDWQRFMIDPTEAWCFDSRTDRERHPVPLDVDDQPLTKGHER